MRNPRGYATIVGDLDHTAPTIVDHGIRHTETEVDTFTCAHCCRVVHVPPNMSPTDLGGLCVQCDGLICPKCVGKRACTPWEKEMERREAAGAARRSYGL